MQYLWWLLQILQGLNLPKVSCSLSGDWGQPIGHQGWGNKCKQERRDRTRGRAKIMKRQGREGQDRNRRCKRGKTAAKRKINRAGRVCRAQSPGTEPKIFCATSIQPLEADVIFHYKFTGNFCLVLTSAGYPVSPICVASQVLISREKETHYAVQLIKYSQWNELRWPAYNISLR